MSQGRRDSERKKKRCGQGIELSQVAVFLRAVGTMAAALFIVSLLFFLLFPKTDATRVVYLITLSANLIAGAGGIFGARYLEKRDKNKTDVRVEEKQGK